VKDDKRALIAELERLTPDSDKWDGAYRMLVAGYLEQLKEHDFSRTQSTNESAEAEARYRLSKELRAQGDSLAAAQQLEAIPPGSALFDSAQSDLTPIYVVLGSEKYVKRQWHEALEWWNKLLAKSGKIEGALQVRYQEAKWRAWFQDNGLRLALISLLGVHAKVVRENEPGVG